MLERFLEDDVVVSVHLLTLLFDRSGLTLHHLAERFGADAFLLSLMAQYTPMREDPDYPELNRRITKMEYNSVCKAAQDLGFDGYFQEKSSADASYTPDFSLQGI